MKIATFGRALTLSPHKRLSFNTRKKYRKTQCTFIILLIQALIFFYDNLYHSTFFERLK